MLRASAAETTGQHYGAPAVEIQHMMAVLRSLELTHGARNTEDIQMSRRGEHVTQYSATPCDQQGLAGAVQGQARCEKSSECARKPAQCPAIWRA